MIFIKDLPTHILPAYNSNKIVYKTSETKTPVKSVITYNKAKFELTPNLNGEFKFDFLQITKTINENKFKENIDFDLLTSIIHQDETLFKELNFDIKIFFADGTNESETKQYKFLKSVIQILNDKRDINYSLFPLVQNSSELVHLTYFEGYPYDIPIYSNTDTNVTVQNKSTQHQIELNLKSGVNRFCVSDGKNNISLLNILPLYIGDNELEFKIGNKIYFTIILKKVDAKCGNYVKWFNQSGAFSYWLFPLNYIDATKGKTIEVLAQDTENGNFLITGKNGSQSIKTTSQLLSINEYEYLKEIQTSPRVYYYNEDRYLNFNKWVDVRIKDNAVPFISKHRNQKITTEIILPNLQTQTL